MRRCLRSVHSLIVCCSFAMVLLCASAAKAHEIPGDVIVRVIVAPQAGSLNIAVRAPLEAMRDFDFPSIGPGYLDFEQADAQLQDAAQLWIADALEVYADGRALTRPRISAVRASLPSDRSFTGYDSAAAHVRSAPLSSGINLVWQQALIDVLLEVPLDAQFDVLSLRPALQRLGIRVRTVVRFEASDGAVRLYQYDGDPGVVELDPRWYGAAWRFVVQGFEHILSGLDHLLFLLCLVLPFYARLKSLVLIVTAFTIGHSVTLIGAAYGLAPASLWFAPLVETLIAASILYMAIENVIAPNLRARWALAAGFGLIHGFGFSSALRDTLQFAGEHHVVALLSFNVGVELGQLLVLLLLVPILRFVLPRVRSQQTVTVVISVIVGHTAWHWMADRYQALSEFGLLSRFFS